MGRVAGAIALALAASRASVALADVNGYLTAGAAYDGNLFRAPDGQAFPGFSKSDDIFSLGGGGSLNLANPHFQLNGTIDVGQSWYSRNSFLNSLSYDGSLELTERQKYIDLDVEAAQSQSLSSFADIRSPIRNLQSLTRTAARIGLAATADVRLVFDVKFNRDTNSNALVAQADYNQPSGGVGIGYFSPSGNSVVVEELRTYTQGVNEQIFLLANGLVGSKINYVDDTTSLQVGYSPSPVISLFAQAGYLRRTDQSILHDNVNTPVGLIRLSYLPDAIVQVDVSAGRQLSSQSYLLVEGVQDNYIKAKPMLKFNNGLLATLDFSYDHRSYGVVQQLGLGPSNAEDQTLRYDASLSYKLLDNYEVGLSAYHEERHSSAILDTYTDSGFMLTLTLRSARPVPPPDGLEKADLLLLP
jgi:hypothetical protein